jgi:hypothetical protein
MKKNSSAGWIVSGILLVLVLVLLFAKMDYKMDKKMENDIEYEIKVQRATQAAIWMFTAVAAQDIPWAIRRDLNGKPGQVVALTQPMTSQHGFLTANDVTPYNTGGLYNVKEDPLVIDFPAATERVNMFGSIINAWQRPIADVGEKGADKGEGGKYLIIPPEYKGEIPEGYLVVQSDTNKVHYAFRPVATPLGTTEEAAEHSRKLKVYRLSQADNPPEMEFIDPTGRDWFSQPIYDITYWEDVHRVIQDEVVQEKDKALMHMLKQLEIEDGKPFNPSPETEKALLEGLDLAWEYLQNYFITKGTRTLWEGINWGTFNWPEGQVEAGFTWTTDTELLIDQRVGVYYFVATYIPKNLGGSTFYITGLRDSDGNLFDGTSTYKLNVPADTPAEDFWSVIVYSMKTKGFVYGAPRVGISDKIDGDELIYNDDGSVDIYFGPNPPAGYERNTIPTGEPFFLLFRLYGPGPTFLDGSWKFEDLEKVS